MNFSAVVLAAGASSRMQGRHKLLLPLGAESVVRRTVRQVLASGPRELVVVTGYGAADVTRQLDDLAVAFEFNARHAQGQMGSVTAGCAALREPSDAVMVCLADMALLTSEDYRDLLRAAERCGRPIVVPHHAGQRGNPVLFARSLLGEVVAGGRNLGCRQLIAEHPDEVLAFDVPHHRFTTDLDTPEDYARLLAALEQSPAPGA